MTTVDKTEIEKFSKLARDWWNPDGKFKPLHLFNPTRINFIKEKINIYFKDSNLNTFIVNDENIESKINMTKDVIRAIGRNGT